jgi:molybdate transport system substrate-binding protein
MVVKAGGRMRIDLRSVVPLVLLASFGCGGGKTGPTLPTIRVAAASDLQRAFPVLAARFQLDHGIEAIPTFGSSGTLVEQIKGGAPYDLFLSANRGFVEDLARAGLVPPESVRPYARGRLAIAVPEKSEPGAFEIKSLADLARPEVKAFALANPSFAPYGIAARQALDKAGLWEGLEPKRILSSNVREALQFVESGNVDAAFVGTAIGKVPGVRLIPVDPDAYEPIIQALGVVGRSEHAADAEKFARFLLSEAGQGILRDLQFSTVPTP